MANPKRRQRNGDVGWQRTVQEALAVVSQELEHWDRLQSIDDLSAEDLRILMRHRRDFTLEYLHIRLPQLLRI